MLPFKWWYLTLDLTPVRYCSKITSLNYTQRLICVVRDSENWFRQILAVLKKNSKIRFYCLITLPLLPALPPPPPKKVIYLESETLKQILIILMAYSPQEVSRLGGSYAVRNVLFLGKQFEEDSPDVARLSLHCN